jgi:hypothetical protein
MKCAPGSVAAALLCVTTMGAFIGAPVFAPRATADAHTYTTSRRIVRAAILTSSALNIPIGNIVSPENPDPHVFYILDARTDLKPLGIEYVNPLAPPVVTSSIFQRWRDRVRTSDPAFVANTPESNVFRVGAPVSKNMGAYWELNLDTASDDDLKQYDILYLHSHRQKAVFGPELKEKLRKYIEAGGTLWVENCGLFTFEPTNPFLYDVSMEANYGLGGDAIAVIANPSHPLLSYPYLLGARDVQNLGDKYRNDPTTGGRFLLPGYYLYTVNDPLNQAAPGPDAVNPPGNQTLTPIVWNTRGIAAANPVSPPPGWRPMILAGQVGAGRIIYASQDTGCKINDYAGMDRADRRNAGYGGNSQVISGDVMAASSPPDLKFAYNLTVWTGAHTTAYTDTRHSGGTSEKIGGSLAEKWFNPASGSWRVGGATLFKHCIYAVDGNGVFHCYDSKPEEDLDGDGNVDDGLPDAIYGYPFDEIWNFDLKTIYKGNLVNAGASTPTCYEFYDPFSSGASGSLANFPSREQVAVTLSDGQVVAFRALPRLASNGALAPIGAGQFGFANAEPAVVDWILDNSAVNGLDGWSLGAQANTFTPPAPTWSEGVLFAAVNSTNGGTLGGHIVAIDPRGSAQRGGKALSAFNPTGPPGPFGIDSQAPLRPNAIPPIFLGSPTMGYVRDSVNGAIDNILYVHTDKLTAGIIASQTIRAIPFGTKGELLARQTPTSKDFISRSTGTLPPCPWFRVDQAAPGNASPSLGQRVYAVYVADNGNTYSTELKFTGLAAVAPGPLSEYVAPKPVASGQVQKVTVSDNIKFPGNGPDPGPGTVAATDLHIKVYADYVLDWTLNPTSDPALAQCLVTARSVIAVPDTSTPGGNVLGGPPALSPDDLLYYTLDTDHGGQGTGGPNGNQGRGVLFSVNEQPSSRSVLKWTYAMHNGYTMTLPNSQTTVTVPPRLRQLDQATQTATGVAVGTYITDVQFIGTPAFRKDVVYAVAHANVGGVTASVLCAFKANPEFTIRLNTAIDKTQQVVVRQLNVVRQQGLNQVWDQLTSQPSGQPGLKGNSAITVDYDSGLIHINSMANPGSMASSGGNPGPAAGFVSASMPFVVQVGQQERVVSGQQIDVVNGQQETRIIGAPGVDNLLWYAIIPTAAPANSPFGSPGYVSSSPSIQGDTIFLGTENGFVIALDADPGATDPAAQAAGAQVQLVDATGKLKHLRWIQRVTVGGSVVRAAPAATENVMVVNSADGVHAYEDSFTIVADSNRLIEVNSAGDAVWTCDGTRSFGTAGGDLAQYDQFGNPLNPNNTTGVPVVHKIPFARPSVARRINTNDFLVVDTGNNRVTEIDRGGNVVWEVHRLFDDMKSLLRPGDPTSLNEPTDCSYWTEYTQNLNAWFVSNGMPYTYNNLPGYIIHYLIADTGNFRIVELVDVYNSGGQPVRPQSGGNTVPFTLVRQLYFVSSTYGSQGKQYRYIGAQRTVQQNGSLKGTSFYDPNQPDNAVRRFTLAAITNYRLGSGSANVNGTADQNAGAGGSIIVLDESGAPISVVTNLAIPNGANSYRLQPINHPTSFSKFDVFNVAQKTTVFHYLLSDANGCYQLVSGVDANNNPVMIVEWMLSNEAYYRMTGKQLNAMSVRRLNTAVVVGPNSGKHHFLITNRFSGQDQIPDVFGITQNVPKSAEFNGEVFEISPFDYNVTNPQTLGYTPDYSVSGGFLVPNNGVNGFQSSIVWRSPSELVPPNPVNPITNPNGFVLRFIGSPGRATSTGVLQKPSYADRPF